MGTVSAHELKRLPREECLVLFNRFAFKEGSEKQYPRYAEEIVDKCNRVPLAVRTLGSLLCGKTDENDWLRVKNEIWKLEQKEGDILPVLKLNYDEFSGNLKRCFASCCMFPKDSGISLIKLIPFWIAQGIIQTLEDEKELEAIGMRYFNYLFSISFFQCLYDDEGETPPLLRYYRMHDLVHDLASLVSRDFAVVNYHTQGISERVRHISFSDDGDSSHMGLPSSILKQSNLRTIMNLRPLDQSLVDKCISSFNYLRLLDLSGSGLETLPDSIGKLKHLRYLDLSDNFGIKMLPNSICKLENLQTLFLFRCVCLETLPKHIGNLINLRALGVTTKQKCFPEEGIGGLISLRSLYFIKCDNMESLPIGIQNLTSLRTLMFSCCESLTCLPTGMKYLTALEDLFLVSCENLCLTDWEWNEGRTSLRSFLGMALPKLTALPRWLQDAANTITKLTIMYCENLEPLPEWFGNLTAFQV